MKFLALLMMSGVLVTSAWACDRPPLGDYDWVGCIEDGVSISYQGIKHGLVDVAGDMLIAPEYRKIHRLGKDGFGVSNGEKWGAIDLQGRVILPMEYDHLLPQDDSYYEIIKDGKHGMMHHGQMIIQPKYGSLSDVNGLIVAMERRAEGRYGNYGLIDHHDRVMLPFEYDKIFGFGEYFVVGKGDRVQLLDSNLQVVDQFEDVDRSYHDYLPVKRGGRWGAIDKSKKQIIPFMYDEILMGDEGLFPVERDGRWGVVDTHNQIVADFDYDFIFGFNDDVAVVKKDDRYGYINTDGELVMQFNHSLRHGFYHGLAEVVVYDQDVNGDEMALYGVTDKSGNLIVPPRYHGISIPYFDASKGISIEINKKHGMLDRSGEPMIDVLYDEPFFFHQGRAEVSKDGRGFYIDEQGRQIGGSWLIHEKACRHIQVGQQFEVMIFLGLAIPMEVVSVDAESRKVIVKELLEDKDFEIKCEDIPDSM